MNSFALLKRLEGLLFDVFRVAHGHCPRFRGEKGGGVEEILSVLMHLGLVVFDLKQINYLYGRSLTS